MERMNVGIIGCGAISKTYLVNKDVCPILNVTRVADILPAAASERACEYGVKAVSVDEIIGDPEIELVIVLTPPSSHYELCIRAMEAGKHVYTEKPMGIDTTESAGLLAKAERTGRRLGCAPDTFLAGAHQHCRQMVDSGAIGEVFAGHAHFTAPAYPGKQFFADPGGGPLFDQGVYLVTNLVNLLGPIRRVASFNGTALEAYRHPVAGADIKIGVPTWFTGVLEFSSGAAVTMLNAWGIKQPYGPHIDLFGTRGALYVPDPNQPRAIESFTMTRGGEIDAKPDDWTNETVTVTFPNRSRNPRIIGAAEMAHAIRSGRPHRASGALGHHVVEVMEKMTRSCRTGIIESIESDPGRPEPVDPGFPDGAFE
jgi:predicted dehydrogenase